MRGETVESTDRQQMPACHGITSMDGGGTAGDSKTEQKPVQDNHLN